MQPQTGFKLFLPIKTNFTEVHVVSSCRDQFHWCPCFFLSRPTSLRFILFLPIKTNFTDVHASSYQDQFHWGLSCFFLSRPISLRSMLLPIETNFTEVYLVFSYQDQLHWGSYCFFLCRQTTLRFMLFLPVQTNYTEVHVVSSCADKLHWGSCCFFLCRQTTLRFMLFLPVQTNFTEVYIVSSCADQLKWDSCCFFLSRVQTNFTVVLVVSSCLRPTSPRLMLCFFLPQTNFTEMFFVSFSPRLTCLDCSKCWSLCLERIPQSTRGLVRWQPCFLPGTRCVFCRLVSANGLMAKHDKCQFGLFLLGNISEVIKDLQLLSQKCCRLVDWLGWTGLTRWFYRLY